MEKQGWRLSLFRMFRKFDTNKDGVIDFKEFEIGMQSGMNLTQMS